MKTKKVALITGASTGIGKEFANIHAEKGGDIVIVARRKDKLDALKNELEKKHGVKVMVIAKDLATPEAPKEIYDEIDEFEEIDLFGNKEEFLEFDDDSEE